MMLQSDTAGALSPKEEKALLWLTIAVAAVLVIVLVAISILIWEHNRDNPHNHIVMFVPIAILEWSFAGAMVSVLDRLAYRRKIHHVGLELYIWAIAKPFMGIFLGSLIYFVALAGARLLSLSPDALRNTPVDLSNALWLNAVAFMGGFSDQFSLRIISRLLRRRVGYSESDNQGAD